MIFACACDIPCIGDMKRVSEHGNYTTVSNSEQQSTRLRAINRSCRVQSDLVHHKRKLAYDLRTQGLEISPCMNERIKSMICIL
jgi:hypothetical protein